MSRLVLAATVAALGLTAFAWRPRWVIHLRGANTVTYGMTVAEAARAAGDRLRVEDSGNDNQWECGYVVPDQTSGLSFMTERGRVVRADVINPSIRTVSGIGVGSSEADVRRAYGSQIRVEPHPYGDANDHYMVYVPRDRADRNYRVIFGTFDGYVTGYRSGLRPAVEYIEGCL